MPSPHDQLFLALGHAGWTITSRAQAGGGPNPTRIEIQRGRRRHRLLIYAWRITLEGKGRTKAGREDLDYRIQTTRSHQGPLMTPLGYLACGLGWDEERAVFASFDPWVKRFTGVSSSVHIPRALLDEAAKEGWASLERPDYGPEAAFKPAGVDPYLDWTLESRRRRLIVVEPSEYKLNGEEAEVLADGWKQPWVSWLRPGDRIVLERSKKLLDASVWTIVAVDRRDQETASGNYQRILLELRCSRYGMIKDPSWLDQVRN